MVKGGHWTLIVSQTVCIYTLSTSLWKYQYINLSMIWSAILHRCGHVHILCAYSNAYNSTLAQIFTRDCISYYDSINREEAPVDFIEFTLLWLKYRHFRVDTEEITYLTKVQGVHGHSQGEYLVCWINYNMQTCMSLSHPPEFTKEHTTATQWVWLRCFRLFGETNCPDHTEKCSFIIHDK